MKYVRPFDVDSMAPATVGHWLVRPDEAGCSIRLCRGGAPDEPATTGASYERYALVLRGKAHLMTADGTEFAMSGELIVIPKDCRGAVGGAGDAVWLEIDGVTPIGSTDEGGVRAYIARVDPKRFVGSGFNYQILTDRSAGSRSMQMNVVEVQPGSGSPDFHIHKFNQIYIIQSGEMTLDVGRARTKAGKDCIVLLPSGVVHRNFNGSHTVERHVSLLVPQPSDGEIYDYAVTIHEKEAEFLRQPPS
jgi:mannose-6-phosphate isomerase-like protein (cupin superfamily)